MQIILSVFLLFCVNTYQKGIEIMKATPVKGTRDYLPKEVMIRDHLQEIIRETYQEAGFERITTPIIEDAVNLDKSEGGDSPDFPHEQPYENFSKIPDPLHLPHPDASHPP